MSKAKKSWITVTESRYPWERDALDFVCDRWPDHGPYRAWANFEFIALDGSINEVDLLLLTPMGFFLVEIKSRPGRVFGDPGTWTWETDGRLITTANPLLSANLKAKKLRQLLERQKAVKVMGSLPWVEALVFLSAPDLKCELRDTAAYRVCLRDRDASPGQAERPGLLAAVRRRECPGLEKDPRTQVDRPLAKIISQAMEQAGIHSSQRHRRVSDYLLERLIQRGGLDGGQRRRQVAPEPGPGGPAQEDAGRPDPAAAEVQVGRLPERELLAAPRQPGRAQGTLGELPALRGGRWPAADRLGRLRPPAAGEGDRRPLRPRPGGPADGAYD